MIQRPEELRNGLEFMGGWPCCASPPPTRLVKGKSVWSVKTRRAASHWRDVRSVIIRWRAMHDIEYTPPPNLNENPTCSVPAWYHRDAKVYVWSYDYSHFFFFFLSIPFIIFALPSFSLPSRNWNPGSQTRLLSLLPHYGYCFAFLSREDFSIFFPRQLSSNFAYPFYTMRSRQSVSFENRNLHDGENRTLDIRPKRLRGYQLDNRGPCRVSSTPPPPSASCYLWLLVSAWCLVTQPRAHEREELATYSTHACCCCGWVCLLLLREW